MDGHADGADTASRLGDALRDSDATLATAESCTGGLLASTVTDVPGASDYFYGGYVTYAYEAKLRELGVSREALDDHGAGSEPVAHEMARRARDRAGTTWGLSVTGTAGPTGGTPEKPVGTVYVGVASAGEWGSGNSYAAVEGHRFDGDRTTVKERATRSALALLLAHVEGDAADAP